mgnify:CR=1 FL=1
MNRKSLVLLISFLSLLFFQIFVFNNMNIFGFVNPMIYIVFLVIYNFDSDQTLFILICFLLGFSIDFFSQSGGAHTITSLTMSFLRPILIRNSYGVTSEIPVSFHTDTRRINKYTFLSLLFILHHLIYFSIVFFDWNAVHLILKNTFLTFIFSLTLSIMVLNLYRKPNDS